MSLRPAQSLGRHPFSRSYRAILPSSLNTITTDTPTSFQRGAPVSDLGTDIHFPFSRAPGICSLTPLLFGRVLTITVLHQPIQLRQSDDSVKHIRKRQDCRMNGTGILTCFPVDLLELRQTLGPTNPRLTNIVEET